MEIAASALGAAPMGAGPTQPLSYELSPQEIHLITSVFSHNIHLFSGNFHPNLRHVPDEDERLQGVPDGPIIGVWL